MAKHVFSASVQAEAVKLGATAETLKAIGVAFRKSGNLEEAVKSVMLPEQTQGEQTGRTVPNQARPARIGFSASLAATAAKYGWTLVPVDDPDPRIIHIYGGKSGNGMSGGSVLTSPTGTELHVSYFPTRDGSSDRLDAAYLWTAGATSGRRVQTVYQVMDTIANGGTAVAAPDASRKRTQAEQAEVSEGNEQAETPASAPTGKKGAKAA